jgi:ABC-type bacteriocin/lantibiotic exporter with double-glycine peptidase domain
MATTQQTVNAIATSLKGKKSIRPVQRFFRLLRADQKDIYYIYIYAIFSGLITLSIPLGIQAIIGLIAGGAMSFSLVLLIAVVTVGTALSGLLKVMQLTVAETIQRRIFSRSAFDFALRIPRIQLEALQNSFPPELINRFFDTLTLQKGVPKIIMDLSSAILQIFTGLILLSFYHPFFVFFGILLLLILIIIFRFTGPSGLTTSLKESKYKYEVAYWLEELGRAMNTFKLAGENELYLGKTDLNALHYLEARKKHFRILLIQYGSIVGFKTLVTAGLLALGSWLVIQNQLNIGQFVAAEIVILIILTSAEKLILTMETIYDVMTALEKLGNVTDLPLEKEEGLHFEEIDKKCGVEIHVKDLSFQFSDAETPTLDNISLDVEPGQRICIAGYNGAGKTTLLRMMAGLYQDYQGSISYNGYPLRNLNVISLRQHIGDVFSEEEIIKGTVSENITLGRPDVNIENMLWAAEKVGIDKHIRQLPEGFETALLPGGRNIPSHIRQKIILARSLAIKPRLLVMEDPLDHIEKKEHLPLVELLTSKERTWTLVVVSNDPLIAMHCDRILVMCNGKIEKELLPGELMQSPYFKDVFDSSRPDEDDILQKKKKQSDK